jgi:hypothetical protein
MLFSFDTFFQIYNYLFNYKLRTHELGVCLWFDKNAIEAADFLKNTFSEFDLDLEKAVQS